jgi:hypothetical protein
MRKLAAIGALGFLAAGLYAQGLNPPPDQSKESWEEINFEFNSSILSDGYPSLLRLADLLQQHRDYKVGVRGHTDSVGSATYNEKLAMARAEAVKSFLVKYGAAANQVTVTGDGKRSPSVDNKVKEGRFINRRVVLTLTDGQGKIVKEGGISDAIDGLQQLVKKQEECCSQILKRLDKLDDILAAINNLKGENDKLRGEMADLRNQQNALKDQVTGLPKPLDSQQTTAIAHKEATGAIEEAQQRNKKFSDVGINIGPTIGANRTGNYNVSGRARFFSPFGSEGTQAVQAQGEYSYYSGRQEGQLDLGLVNRWRNLQVGAFGSFKYLNFKQYQNGAGLMQASFLADWIFKRGRVGVFGTHGIKNYGVVNRANLGPASYIETYARVVNQYGVNAQVGVWDNAYVEGNIGYLRRHEGSSRPGGTAKLIQPVTKGVALTFEAGWNETMLAAKDTARVAFGVQFGNMLQPKQYADTKSPVPMDVPRVRYEMGTRRSGNSVPVANAGADQLNASTGTITLDGSGSYDPDGDAITYQWAQTSGPTVTLSNAKAAAPTFTASAGQAYVFKLTVTDSGGLTSSALTTVSTRSTSMSISSFYATPSSIAAGASTQLSWVVVGADSVNISPALGNVSAAGTSTVTPTETTTYTLTATSNGVSIHSTVTVTVGSTSGPQILRFEANPMSVQAGQQVTLSWATSGATSASISGGVGTVAANGSTTVTPAQTTTYTLTATSSDGKTVTSPLTVTVGAAAVPQVLAFTASPVSIDAGASAKVCWQVTGASSISIVPNIGTGLSANDCASVNPTATTTYTLTATNSSGQMQSTVTVYVGQTRILSFNATPIYSTRAGDPVTLNWQTQNATSVVLVGADISARTLDVNGSTTVNPISNQNYTLTAYGPGGQTVSVTIEVFVR